MVVARSGKHQLHRPATTGPAGCFAEQRGTCPLSARLRRNEQVIEDENGRGTNRRKTWEQLGEANALTRRIAVSVALIVLVVIGIYSGWIKPHGIGG